MHRVGRDARLQRLLCAWRLETQGTAVPAKGYVAGKLRVCYSDSRRGPDVNCAAAVWNRSAGRQMGRQTQRKKARVMAADHQRHRRPAVVVVRRRWCSGAKAHLSKATFPPSTDPAIARETKRPRKKTAPPDCEALFRKRRESLIESPAASDRTAPPLIPALRWRQGMRGVGRSS